MSLRENKTEQNRSVSCGEWEGARLTGSAKSKEEPLKCRRRAQASLLCLVTPWDHTDFSERRCT